MHIQKLTLACYKNHSDTSFEFCKEINCLYGSNGSGKTNVLDAIYFLGAGRSYFTRNDKQSIPFENSFARWFGDFDHAEELSTHAVVLQDTGKKSIHRNGSLVQKLSDFVTKVPMVLITPSDIELINGTSDERRRLMDRTISLSNPSYLKSIQRYNRLLLLRNELLKKFAMERNTNLLTLQAIDAQLIPEGDYIHKTRKIFVEEFGKEVSSIYRYIAQNSEEVGVDYESDVHQISMSEILEAGLKQDLYAQRTLSGVHKDDLILNIKGHSVKKYGSQGQIKTMTISMNLATYMMLTKIIGAKPILLLDDIYEKIDEQRADNLMSLIAGDGFGQIFITDTSIDRMQKRLENIKAEKKFFNIERA